MGPSERGSEREQAPGTARGRGPTVPAEATAADRHPPAIAPLGVILAGGRGSRLGGEKATADLAGRPLISYPLAALEAAGLDAFVVAKPSTELDIPALSSSPEPRTANPAPAAIEIVTEQAEPTHPLTGIVAALRHAMRPLVILGCDFPFVPAALLRLLADSPEPLVVPAPGGAPQPLVARWTPELLPRLEEALAREEPLLRTVSALSPRLINDAELRRFGDPARAFFNVNTPDDLRAAARMAAEKRSDDREP